MDFFISVDTYRHQPRNIFGFKKKRVQPEINPVSISIFSSDGDFYKAQFKSAKTRDDQFWDNVFLSRDEYGEKKTDSTIMREALIFIRKKIYCSRGKSTIVYLEPSGCLFVERLMDEAASFVPKGNDFNQEIIDNYLYAVAETIDESIFEKRQSEFEVIIHLEEGEGYSFKQKLDAIFSHKQYPTILPGEMSLARAHKTYLTYCLLKSFE